MLTKVIFLNFHPNFSRKVLLLVLLKIWLFSVEDNRQSDEILNQSFSLLGGTSSILRTSKKNTLYHCHFIKDYIVWKEGSCFSRSCVFGSCLRTNAMQWAHIVNYLALLKNMFSNANCEKKCHRNAKMFGWNMNGIPT